MGSKEPIDASGNARQFEAATRFIESSLADPEIERILEKALLLDEYLRTFPTTIEKRSQIIKELDGLWKPWMKTPIQMSGELRLYKHGQLSDPIIVGDLEGISNGFNVIPVQSPEEDLVVDPRWRYSRVAHDIYVWGEGLGDEYEDGMPHRALAVVDRAIIQTDLPSSERAMMWLEASSPYFLEEVDRRITKTRSVEEALLALKGFQIDTCIDMSDTLSRNSAEVYLNTMIQLDPKVHYDMHINGVTYQSTQQGTAYSIHRQLHALGKLGKLSTLRGVRPDGSVKWELVTPTELEFLDVTADSFVCDVPVSSIVAIRSLRKAALDIRGTI